MVGHHHRKPVGSNSGDGPYPSADILAMLTVSRWCLQASQGKIGLSPNRLLSI